MNTFEFCILISSIYLSRVMSSVTTVCIGIAWAIGGVVIHAGK